MSELMPVVSINVELDSFIGNFSRLNWRSTGMCPPLPHESIFKWLNSTAMMINLLHISQLPRQDEQLSFQVRIHWMLDMITVSCMDNYCLWNWTKLDRFMDKLNLLKLRPGFELMGNPSKLFTDFEDKLQIYRWASLIQDLAIRYIGRYGLTKILAWNFETWNEPSKHAFETLNVTIAGYLNYFDACREGLRRADPRLRLGGPGGECHRFSSSSFCWSLLHHVSFERSYFGYRPTLDFISIHKKGISPLNTDSIDKLERNFKSIIRQKFPSLDTISIYNDESDPLVGWSRSEAFHADVRYAAIFMKLLSMQREVALFSSDNAFLNYQPYYFTQRTLLAMFMINSTKPSSLEFVQKPIYAAFSLASLHGGLYLETAVESARSSEGCRQSPNVTIIATRSFSPPEVVLTVTQMLDTATGCDQTVNIHLNGAENIRKDFLWVGRVMDNQLTNPFSVWKRNGSPECPSKKLVKEMQRVQGAQLAFGPAPVRQEISMKLATPGILSIHICTRLSMIGAKIFGLHVLRLSSSTFLLFWNPILSRCVLTYQIKVSVPSKTPEFLPSHNLINAIYFYRAETCLPRSSSFQVRAINFWGEPSKFSNPVHARSDTR